MGNQAYNMTLNLIQFFVLSMRSFSIFHHILTKPMCAKTVFTLQQLYSLIKTSQFWSVLWTHLKIQSESCVAYLHRARDSPFQRRIYLRVSGAVAPGPSYFGSHTRQILCNFDHPFFSHQVWNCGKKGVMKSFRSRNLKTALLSRRYTMMLKIASSSVSKVAWRFTHFRWFIPLYDINVFILIESIQIFHNQHDNIKHFHFYWGGK